MREGRRQSSVLVASIFVNPTQFGPVRIFARYPPQLRARLRDARDGASDVVFAPEPSAMYSPDAADVGGCRRDYRWPVRRTSPGHFRGVTTVVAEAVSTS